jgi:hypothetical protein
VLTRFDSAINELVNLFDYGEWRSEEERDRLLSALPRIVRDAMDGWSELLDDRIIAAPGYIGTHEIITHSLASDSWSVHWAMNGRAAAKVVEQAFREDLALLQPVLRRARKAVPPE